MDRTRPLWEICYVDGLGAGDTIGVITKIHHCMVDGTSGVELGTLLYDLTPEGTKSAPVAWQPEPEPSRANLLLEALRESARIPIDVLSAFGKAMGTPSAPIDQVVRFVKAIETVTEQIDNLPFNARVSSRRRFDTVAVPLKQILLTRRAFDVKVNDVILAAVAGALRSYCENRRIKPTTLQRVRALVPVDRRQPGDTQLGSKVSSLFVELPVAERSVSKRLQLLRRQTRSMKDQRTADGTEMWNRFMSILPAAVLRTVSRVQFRELMSTSNLLLSNVRGPSAPLYSSRGRVLELYPYFGVQDNLGLTIVALSYDGQVNFGIVTDPELTPDADVLVAAIPRACAEMHGLALRRLRRARGSIAPIRRSRVQAAPTRRSVAAAG